MRHRFATFHSFILSTMYHGKRRSSSGHVLLPGTSSQAEEEAVKPILIPKHVGSWTFGWGTVVSELFSDEHAFCDVTRSDLDDLACCLTSHCICNKSVFHCISRDTLFIFFLVVTSITLGSKLSLAIPGVLYQVLGVVIGFVISYRASSGYGMLFEDFNILTHSSVGTTGIGWEGRAGRTL